MGGDRILCSVLGDKRMFVDANDYDISPHIIMDGAWEEHISNVIISRLQEGMVAVDVGANVGYFTILMAMLCGRAGHVLSFEPNPRSSIILKDNVALNGISDSVTVFDFPLGDEDHRAVTLAVNEYHPGGAQLTTIPGAAMQTHHLETRRLDGVPGSHDATLVKIDTEGFEQFVWRGMTALLTGDNLRYIVIEFTYRSYADPEGFLREIESHGFTISLIKDDTGDLIHRTVEEVLCGPSFQMLLLQR